MSRLLKPFSICKLATQQGQEKYKSYVKYPIRAILMLKGGHLAYWKTMDSSKLWQETDPSSESLRSFASEYILGINSPPDFIMDL